MIYLRTISIKCLLVITTLYKTKAGRQRVSSTVPSAPKVTLYRTYGDSRTWRVNSIIACSSRAHLHTMKVVTILIPSFHGLRWEGVAYKLQSSSKVLGKLPVLPLFFRPPPAPGPMLIKTLMFVRVIVLLYPNIEQGGRGIFSKRENSLFSGLKWTPVKLYSLPN